MTRCKKCYMPDTRPKVKFTNGVCQACINYENRKNINYEQRRRSLHDILQDARHERLRGNAEYDCVIAVSGGKDSYFIVSTLVEEYEVKPLLVTVTDEFTHTEAGKHNLSNLVKRFNCDHILFRCEPQTFVKETKKDFEWELHPLKWIEEKIYQVPINIAKKFGVKLVFFGENPEYEYGRTENLYELHHLSDDKVRVHYFGAYYPWTSTGNLEVAKRYGFRSLDDTGEWSRQGTIEQFEQIDSVAYMIQLWTKYPKFGFQRVCDIASRRVREGILSFPEAKALINAYDKVCDPRAKADFCSTIGISEEVFDLVVAKHRKYF